MARNTKEPVQQFRGTTAQHASYHGEPGEITVDTTKNTVVVQDGKTNGGHPLAKAATKISAGSDLQITSGGTLGQNTTINAKIGSKTQRGTLQVGENLDVDSSGVLSSKEWTGYIADLDNVDMAELQDNYHDGAIFITNDVTADYRMEDIVHAAMPSSKYVDLAVPAHAGKVVAPADGYIQLTCNNAVADSAWCGLSAQPMYIMQNCSKTQGMALFIPVYAGQSVTVYYVGISVATLRFVYCNGNAPKA